MKCANGHEWTSFYEGEPEIGTPCDCKQKQWGAAPVTTREGEPHEQKIREEAARVLAMKQTYYDGITGMDAVELAEESLWLLARLTAVEVQREEQRTRAMLAESHLSASITDSIARGRRITALEAAARALVEKLGKNGYSIAASDELAALRSLVGASIQDK